MALIATRTALLTVLFWAVEDTEVRHRDNISHSTESDVTKLQGYLHKRDNVFINIYNPTRPENDLGYRQPKFSRVFTLDTRSAKFARHSYSELGEPSHCQPILVGWMPAKYC